MAKRKRKPEDPAEKARRAALAQQKLEEERARFLRTQDYLLEKLGEIVGVPGAKIYEIVQGAMPSAESPLKRLVYLAKLILDFTKLQRAKVERHTSLLTILHYQIEGGKSGGRGGRRTKPFHDLSRMDRMMTEPMYVYRPSRARKRLVH